MIPASRSIRLAARVVDALLLTVVDLALGGGMGFGFDWLLVGSAIVFVYFTLGDALAGGTVGKRVFGLSVHGPDGGRPTVAQAAAREAFTVVGAVPFVGPLLALGAWIAIGTAIGSSPTGQGPHDRLAGGTRVVRSGGTFAG